VSKRLSKTDLEFILERFITSRFAKLDSRVRHYAVNEFAICIAKLRNIKEMLGYNFEFIEESVENVGLAKAVKSLDMTTQVTLKVASKRKRKH